VTRSSTALLKAVHAELFEREMSTGRNRALLLGVRDDQDVAFRAVVKLAARLERPPVEYIREWMASAVGRRLGIDTPEPLAVEISPEFAAAIGDARVRTDMSASIGVAFGSTFEGGLTQWKRDNELPSELRDSAAELIVFDVLVHNFDRRRENPNVLVGRDRVVAIDHDLAFAFLDPISPPEPALDPLAGMRNMHVFGRSLGSRMVFSLDRIQNAIGLLDEQFFDDLRSSTPAPWTTGTAGSNLEQTISMLRQRRDAVATWLPQVNAWIRS